MGFFEKITKVDFRLQNHIFEIPALDHRKTFFFIKIDEFAPFFESKSHAKHDPTIFRIQKISQNKIEVLPPQNLPPFHAIFRTGGDTNLKSIRKRFAFPPPLTISPPTKPT